MKKLIIALTLLCSLCLFAACTEGQNESDQNGNGEPPAQTEEIRTVELGISRIDFTAKIIDASKETPVCYVDVESQLRKEDKSAYTVLVDYFDADLFCLAVNLDESGELVSMDITSYVDNTNTGVLENNASFAWNVYIDGEKADIQTTLQEGDELVFVYESVSSPADLSQTDYSRANKYLYVKNDCVSIDFSMEIRADETILLEKTEFVYYIDKADYFAMCEANAGLGIPFSAAIEEVCGYADLDYANNAGSVCIGDYIGGMVNDEFHSWNIMGSSEQYTGSQGTSDGYAAIASGADYILFYA